MNRIVLVLIGLIVINPIGWAQTELSEEKIYQNLKRSIVMVSVKPAGGVGDKSMCTGFVWEKEDQVVTSLHAMQLGGTISVKYFNDSKYTFSAEPIAVYQDADLVLLKVNKRKKDDPAFIEIPPVVPWTKSNLRSESEKLVTGEYIYTIGYPGGARVASSMDLKKGWIDKPPPETLESFLDYKYVEQLRKHAFPRIDIKIVYVRGSLAAGYSGSPCVDKYGRLVGIGDGGLENGARGVSWLIPSEFLKTLEVSSVRRLPDVLATNLHFSSTRPYTEGEDDNLARSPIYDSIASEDFEFYLVKNRSLKEMYESSGNDYNLIRILNQFKNEFKVSINPDSLRFDVYEDIKHGVVVAIPEGKTLYYHKADNHFQVDTTEGRDVNILFNGKLGDYTDKDIMRELDLTFRWLLDSMKTYWKVDDFIIDHKFDYINNLYDNPNISDDDNLKVANVLYKSNPSIDKDGSSVTVFLYVTLIKANEKKFLSVASYKISNDRLNSAKENNLNCLDGYNENSDCEYFEAFIAAFCSSHLITFAY